jgi:hypothetical protein
MIGRSRRRSSAAGWIPGRAEDQVRWSKVLTAQARIAMGYYDRSDVKQLVIDALLKELRRR